MKAFINALINSGKYFFAVPFIVFGVFHFTGAKDMAANMLGDCPVGEILVYLTGLALILAGVSIIIDKMTRLATLLLALLLFLFIVSIHIPGMMNAGNEMAMQMSMAAALKDLALMGAALFFAGTYK